MARAGEEALIARYFAPLSGPGAEGLRDDAASLTPTPGHDLVVTTDAIVAGVHYFPDDPPGSIAAKALGVNLSDLAAKGASPRGFLLTLALPDDWTEAWLADFAEGLGMASRAHGCLLLGGDTVRSGGPALIGVTAFGEVPTGAILRRQAARAGDRLCVSGTIGDAALGLALRLVPDPALAPLHRDTLLDRYLHPRPRLALVPVLRRHARASMDVSDGLAGDLTKMFDGTGLTARIDVPGVPLSPAAQAAIAGDARRIDTALTGGDDYEILCAVPPDSVSALLAEARAAGVPVAEIGTVEAGDGPPRFRDAHGRAMDFARASFSHF
ncbi:MULTISPECIES: thiamine-phosphate kinase [Methylorubrum]|uniref:thiamine-phosphate kinase n=1 Tax=Methylorubrum TaxID=2282523 RepID=UPI0020A1345F|nr:MULTISPECIES: thiamine-phosphate kinase [Methylorubrum]MCP1549052.1 thiamine-monophosphate kinase [Methylorubrum zatmanii]MCP1554336.1 thiamine-monophosphate kinase [Methylorubrum extorquens]MCP1579354.1 thiamine-monophosphate kinase [Methylorubrum extorquens]